MNLSLTVKLLQIFTTLSFTGGIPARVHPKNMTIGNHNTSRRIGSGRSRHFAESGAYWQFLILFWQRCNPNNTTVWIS